MHPGGLSALRWRTLVFHVEQCLMSFFQNGFIFYNVWVSKHIFGTIVSQQPKLRHLGTPHVTMFPRRPMSVKGCANPPGKYLTLGSKSRITRRSGGSHTPAESTECLRQICPIACGRNLSEIWIPPRNFEIFGPRGLYICPTPRFLAQNR